MKFYINWCSAFNSIRNNRKRSLLTMLGIIIGISSVITILAIGRGFERDTIKNLTKNESKNIEIQLNFTPNDYSLYETNTAFFQEADLLVIKGMADIKDVGYLKIDDSQIYKNFYIKGKKKSKQVELLSSKGRESEFGRTLIRLDNENSSKVAEIDSVTAKELFNSSENALGKGLEIDGELFTVVGVFSGDEQDNLFSMSEVNIQVPKKSYLYYFNAEKDTSSVTVTLNTGVEADKVTTDILTVLQEKGTMRNFGEYDVFDASMLTRGVGTILSTITYFITAVASISLFIAGVGIMNMMYISVSERTKEIGIRRALGATRKSIMLQFLFEGLTLTLLGGIIGYLSGMAFAYIVGSMIKVTISIDFFTIFLAIVVSSLIGLVFSVVPAYEAAKKNLIDILRS